MMPSDLIYREDAKDYARHAMANGPNVLEYLDEVPAADFRPVVRGKWVQDCDYHFRCSVCGDRYVVSNGNPLDVANGWNFCPNCGARMDGDKNA